MTEPNAPIELSDVGLDVGITARDPQPLLRFYGEFLGMPLVKHLEHPDAGAHVWFFAVGNGHLKILGFDRLPEAVNPPGGNREATGYRYLAIKVASLDPILAGLEEAGGSIQRPVAEHGASRVVFVGDPEGNCIEFVETINPDVGGS